MEEIKDEEIKETNIKTFLFTFMTVIWYRTWVIIITYCKHNKTNISRNIFLKALKFNLFSSGGIGNTLKPYIIKAIDDGFLMPIYYRKNKHAEIAVKLYSKVYEVIKKQCKDEELKFLKIFTLEFFNNKVILDEEYNDIIKSIDDNDNKLTTCCKLCDTVDTWDINENLLSLDPYENIILKALISAFDQVS